MRIDSRAFGLFKNISFVIVSIIIIGLVHAVVMYAYDLAREMSVWHIVSESFFLAIVMFPILYVLVVRKVRGDISDSERRFQLLYERTPLPYQSLDREGRILEVNQAWTEMLGYTREEVVGRPVSDFIAAGYDQVLAENFPAFMDRGYVQGVEYDLVRKDGTGVRISVNGRIGYNEDGSMKQTHCILTDITERSKAEKAIRVSEEKFRTITENSADAIFIADPLGRYEYVNRTACGMLGYSFEELTGMTIEDLAPPGKASEFRESFGRLLSQGRLFRAMMLRRKDGTEVSVELNAVMLPNGMAFGSCRDITERKLAEKSLEESRKKLELAVEEARSADVAKGHFLANMSHEIRTPLHGIIGLTDLLLETDLTDVQREYLNMVSSSADTLHTIVNDILDFTKIGTGKIEFTSAEFDVRETLKTALSPLELRAKERGLDFSFTVMADVPATIVGDPVRLSQIMINLSDNAIKFTDRGSVAVTVEGHGEDDRGLWLRFSVRDTGTGIPEELMSSIFDCFTQADSSITRRFGGAGLGLAISADLVRLMHGELQVESTVGEGSTFYFTACFGASADRRAGSSSPGMISAGRPAVLSGTAATPWNILVAEDNETGRLIVTQLLEKEGHTVTVAGSGHEVLDHLRRSDFDLILMDVQMPGMDGFQTAKAIREREKGAGRRIPIIAMTAHAMEEHRESCLRAGMDDYISKPVRATDVIRLIGDVLAR